MRGFIIVFFLFFTLNGFSQTGNPEADIRRTVDDLFSAMKNGDSTLLRSCFMENATLKTIFENSESVAKVSGESSIENFVIAVGTPHKEVWNEKIHDVEIRFDGLLAIVWAPYDFYLDDKLQHRGVNAFELVYYSGKWLILSITDTRTK